MSKSIQELLKYSILAEKKGFVNACEGNISILDRDENTMYLTPSQTRKLWLDEEQISVIKDGEQVAGLPRSSEYLLHKAAYDARPDCTAVVHCHTPYITAFAYLNKTLKLECSTAFIACKEIPCLPYGKPGTDKIGAGISELLKDHNLINLANHGCLCVGKDLATTFNLLEMIEASVKVWTIAKQFGEPVRIPEYDELYAEIAASNQYVQL